MPRAAQLPPQCRALFAQMADLGQQTAHIWTCSRCCRECPISWHILIPILEGERKRVVHPFEL